MNHWQNFYHDATAEELDFAGSLIASSGEERHRIIRRAVVAPIVARSPFVDVLKIVLALEK